MKFQPLLFLLCLAGPSLYGQAVPAGVATIDATPNLSALDGELHYALNASQIIDFGYYGSGQTTGSTALSGNVAYSSKSQLKPFSMSFAGGLLIPNGGDQGGVSTYQNISASQALIMKKWILNISDSFSFLPESPTTGVSGIAGIGDIGVAPLPTPSEGISGGLLTYAGDRYSNGLSGGVERRLGALTSISGTGSWGVLHFLDSNAGLNSTDLGGSVSVNRKIDARSSASVGATYSKIDYSGPEAAFAAPSIEVKGINVSYSRVLNRLFSASGSVGPQWVSSSDRLLVPPSLSVAASANLSYVKGHTNASLGYQRGISPGSGVLPGAESDTVSGGIGHPYGRRWMASASGSYQHSTGLGELALSPTEEAVFKQSFNTVYGGVQLSHSFTQHVSGYASYSVQNQSRNIPVPGQNAFTGTSQTLGFGVSFTPRSTRLGQF